MICCITHNFPWEGKDEYVGSELMSPFLPNAPEPKKKKYRLRGRSSETAKAHRG
eukprot:TRINITY_DN700_c0_g1_i4.p6 TRINITY_DN700_c0_g1~~TRINITY_DN700_c0_g1_i4.p6  ORF type:complete len:54 (+),score=23.73 TRINITY_DN700_c0_g1_i4:639-800(+)